MDSGGDADAYDAWAESLATNTQAASSAATQQFDTSHASDAASTGDVKKKTLATETPATSNLNHVFGHIHYAQSTSALQSPAAYSPGTSSSYEPPPSYEPPGLEPPEHTPQALESAAEQHEQGSQDLTMPQQNEGDMEARETHLGNTLALAGGQTAAPSLLGLSHGELEDTRDVSPAQHLASEHGTQRTTTSEHEAHIGEEVAEQKVAGQEPSSFMEGQDAEGASLDWMNVERDEEAEVSGQNSEQTGAYGSQGVAEHADEADLSSADADAHPEPQSDEVEADDFFAQQAQFDGQPQDAVDDDGIDDTEHVTPGAAEAETPLFGQDYGEDIAHEHATSLQDDVPVTSTSDTLFTTEEPSAAEPDLDWLGDRISEPATNTTASEHATEVDTDWLKGDTSEVVAEFGSTQAPEAVEEPATHWMEETKPEANVEDSWAAALGDEKLDDTWGAAFADDDEGFLEDISAPVAVQAPAPPAPSRSVSAYAPSNVASQAAAMPPPVTPFAPATSPFASAYGAVPAAQPQAATKTSTATPMQFFEDLPMTRPPPARRPKQPMVAPTPPPSALPSAMAAAPGARPVPPRTSSAAYAPYTQLQGPEKLNPFPPQANLAPGSGLAAPPIVPTQSAPPASTRYSPALTQPGGALPSKPPTLSTRYAAAQPNVQPGQRTQSPYAPASGAIPHQAQSLDGPITPSIAPQNAFITSPSKLGPTVPSRYSPSSAANATSGATPPAPAYNALPSRPAPPPNSRFVPRTSSPLAQPGQRPQYGRAATAAPGVPNSLQPQPAGQQETYAPNAAIDGLLSPITMQPPPLPGSRSGPPTSALRPPGAPRTLERSVSFAQRPLPQQHFADPAAFLPPQRPRTSSPVHVRQRPGATNAAVERPSTSNQVVSPTSTHAPSTVEHDMQDFVLPNNETALDQLQRWRGSSIFRWGAGGLVISSIPKHIPRYGGGQSAPKLKPMSGEIKLRKYKDVVVEDDGLSTFPGPLKSKGKKKDVLSWLSARITTFEQMADTSKNVEEKILLWKVVRLLVEHDGLLTGSPGVNNAVKDLLSSGLHNSVPSVAPTAPITAEPSHSPDPTTIDQIRAHLLQGDREKAVWLAVDHRRWGHALIISSTMGGDLWKQVVQEFVRKQVRNSGEDSRSLASLYEVFAGNWDESVDQLVPLSARQGFQMVSKAHQPGPARDATEGLEKWRETLSLVVNNRSNGDENALVALGKLLLGYGRVEAAHICYLFARNVAVFGGADDEKAHFALLGTDLMSKTSAKIAHPDSILLTEIYEFALGLAPSASTFFPPHLQAYKLQHAYLLAELGLKLEAQQYCDAIASALKSSTRGSPYYHPLFVAGVEDLSKRLSQSPQTSGSSWMSKLSADKVSGSVWSKFNKFVVGEDADTPPAGTPAQLDEAGPFGRVGGGTPTISRSPSVVDFGGADMSRVPSNVAAGRYGPSAYGTSPDQHRMAPNPYAPYGPSPEAMQKPFERRISSDAPPAMFGSPPRAPGYQRQPSSLSRYSSHESASAYDFRALQPSASYVPTVPEGVALEYATFPSSRRSSAMGAQADGPYRPSAPTTPVLDNDMPASRPQSNRYSSSSAVSDRQPSSRYAPGAQSYEPSTSFETSASSTPSYGYLASASYEPSAPAEEIQSYTPSAPLEEAQPDESTNGYAPVSYGYQAPEAVSEEPAANQEPTSENLDPSSGYQASTYDPSGYQPSNGYAPPTGGYTPYQPDDSPAEVSTDAEDAEGAPKPKKKGIMDLDDEDDDELLKKAEALKKQQQKSKADREADELVRRAAEADAARDTLTSPTTAKKGWLGGWFGSKAPADSLAGGKKDSAPVVHKGKLGEKLSLYYDPETKRWVNPNATPEEAASAAEATKAKPPPPRASGPPIGATPPMGGGLKAPPLPPSGVASPLGSGPPTPGVPLPPSAPGSAPPSRPPTAAGGGMGGVSSIDDLLGGPPGPRAGGTTRGKKKGGNRYVDVMAK